MPFFRYPGGKTKLRKFILDRMKVKDTEGLPYREPFFGGGSFILEVPFRPMWLNDFDDPLMSLWKSVKESPEDLKKAILSFKPSVKAFYEIKEALTDESQAAQMSTLEKALAKLVIHQLSFSGLGVMSGGPLGGVDQKSAYKIDCRWSPEYICKKVDKYSAFFNEHDATFTNGDFQTVIDSPGKSVIYLDPPYYIQGGALYQHSFSDADHKRLAESLKRCEHLWFLSYDDCPEVRALYDWANIESLQVGYTMVTKGGSYKKGEVLISNVVSNRGKARNRK